MGVPAVASSSATFLVSRKYFVILREFFVMVAREFRKLKTLVCDLLAYKLCSMSHTCFEVKVLAIAEVIVGSTDSIKALHINWSWRNQSLYLGLGTSWLLRVTVFYGAVKMLRITTSVLYQIRRKLHRQFYRMNCDSFAGLDGFNSKFFQLAMSRRAEHLTSDYCTDEWTELLITFCSLQFHVGKTKLKLGKGWITKARDSYSGSMQVILAGPDDDALL
ncbi:hypothetical protein BC332_34525 [Capsicum chinense]|nr:hypothetical protein BC332_34525 [Capsicum chinense]